MAATADLHVPNTYAALAEIARRGGALALPSRPLRYRAVPPREWLPELARDLAEDARRAAARIPFESATEERAPELRGWRRLRSLLGRGLDQSQDLVVAHAPAAVLHRLQAPLQEAARRGAQICLLVEEAAADEAFERPTGWIVARLRAKPGPGARHEEEGPPATWVFDRRWLLHHRGSGPQARGARILDPVVATAMADGLLARVALTAALPAHDPAMRRLTRLLEDRP